MALKSLEPDFFYKLDVALANRPDGGTVSDTMSEALGITKSALHVGMVGMAGAAATGKVLMATRDPVVRGVGVVAVCLLAKLLFDYMEAPRRR